MAVQGMGSPAAVRGSPGSTAEHCGAGAVCGGAPSQDGGVGPLRPGGEPLGCSDTGRGPSCSPHCTDPGPPNPGSPRTNCRRQSGGGVVCEWEHSEISLGAGGNWIMGKNSLSHSFRLKDVVSSRLTHPLILGTD